MILILDTHVLVWYLSGDARLSPKVKKAIQKKDIHIVVPAISVAELIHLQKRGKIPVSTAEIKSLLASAPNLTVFPIDMQVIDEMAGGLDIHDALIVATAILLEKTKDESVALATIDDDIIESKLVKIFW